MLNNMGRGMYELFRRCVLLGGIALLALLPGHALSHDTAAPSVASNAATVPKTQFELNLVDTSKNDPLEGGEVPVQGADVRLDVNRERRLFTGGVAKEGEVSGSYQIPITLDSNGSYTAIWHVKPKDSPAFQAEQERSRKARIDPGPSQPGAGAGHRFQPPGRHARTHPKRPAASSGQSQAGAAEGSARSSRTPTHGSWSPRRRR